MLVQIKMLKNSPFSQPCFSRNLLIVLRSWRATNQIVTKYSWHWIHWYAKQDLFSSTEEGNSLDVSHLKPPCQKVKTSWVEPLFELSLLCVLWSNNFSICGLFPMEKLPKIHSGNLVIVQISPQWMNSFVVWINWFQCYLSTFIFVNFIHNQSDHAIVHGILMRNNFYPVQCFLLSHNAILKWTFSLIKDRKDFRYPRNFFIFLLQIWMYLICLWQFLSSFL